LNKVLDAFGQPSPEIQKKLEKAVLETFSTGDFHQANMRAIAKKAGVSFGTIYKYYQSKENLLFSFIDEWLSELIERMIDHLQGLEDIKEKLRKIFWVQLEFYEKNPDVGKIIMMTVPLKTWMTDETYKQERMTEILLRVLREGQQKGVLDPGVPTLVLLDVMHAMVARTFTMWMYRGQKESLAAQASLLFEMVWRAISNPDHASGRSET